MSKHDYDAALSRLDKDTRTCFKYLEKLITEKFNSALAAYQPPAPRVDLGKIEIQLESLQNQIGRLKPKIEAGYTLSQEHDDQEKYLKNLTVKAEKILDELNTTFKEIYDSGYYKEGTRRKIREEGLLGMREEKV